MAMIGAQRWPFRALLKLWQKKETCLSLFAENKKTLSVSSTVGVIGALEAHLGIKYLTGDKKAAGYLHVFDGGEIQKLKIN